MMLISEFDPVMTRIVRAFAMMVLLLVIGTVGYIIVEGWSPHDGLFMTVITMSTVGYGETQPLSPAGRNFTSLLIFLCLVTMTFWSASLTSFIIEQDLTGQFARKRVLKMISQLKQHIVICGTTSTAKALVERLVRKRVPVVVIDDNVEELNKIKKRFRNVHTLVGSATNEIALGEANVINAQTVVAAMQNEVDNLLVGITCKDLGQHIRVIAHSNDPLFGNRMRKTGIDEVVSPSQLCGDHIAKLIREKADAVPG